MRDSMDRREGKKKRVCVEAAKKLPTDLPTVMVVEILSWLPLKSLSKCRCVCKFWLQIISNPHFAKLHLSRSPISILIHENVPKREAGYLRLYQDYGVKESWTTQFRIEDTFCPYSPGDYYCPLILLKNGRMLLSCSDEEVICYNLKENRLTVTDIYAKGDQFSIIAYTPCFVSLKDVAIVEQISRRGELIT